MILRGARLGLEFVVDFVSIFSMPIPLGNAYTVGSTLYWEAGPSAEMLGSGKSQTIIKGRYNVREVRWYVGSSRDRDSSEGDDLEVVVTVIGLRRRIFGGCSQVYYSMNGWHDARDCVL